jgi:hypothetical protein
VAHPGFSRIVREPDAELFNEHLVIDSHWCYVARPAAASPVLDRQLGAGYRKQRTSLEALPDPANDLTTSRRRAPRCTRGLSMRLRSLCYS